MKVDEKNFQTQDNLNNDQVSFEQVAAKFREWKHYLISRKLTVFLFGLLGALISLTYTYLKKPVYTATTTFVLETSESSGGLGQYAGIASMVGIDLGGIGGGSGLFQGDNIFELYQSRMMIEKTLLSRMSTNQLFIDYYIEFNHLIEKWSDYPQLKDIKFDLAPGQQFSRLQDSVIREITKSIRLDGLTAGKIDKKLNVVQINVESIDERFAKEFNDQIVKNVNEFYIQTKTKKSLMNVNILQHKTDSVRAVMTGAIYTGARVSDATPNLNPTRQVQRTAPMQNAQFNAEANKAVLTELLKNLEMSKVSLLRETPLIQVVDVPVFPLEKTKISILLNVLLGFFLLSFMAALWLLIFRTAKTNLNDQKDTL